MKSKTVQSKSMKTKKKRTKSPATSLKRYLLSLYITGSTPRSQRALANIKRICEEHIRGEYELKVVDIYQSPEIAGKEQIIAAPTLIKTLPAPFRRLIGDFSDEERVLLGLDITPKNALPRKG